ncbi:SMC [Parelaphostrongylus tenuis]|uniref:SMC n=1 Tax=Parelaphostrongylus tenuis TaxID=148309 RepID=A0AAD5WG82_PARTN|nr:SMC [Parelaphostrongylus tenuis]
MKNPKERTALFEEIVEVLRTSQEYDRLKAELQKAEDDAQQNMNKRRGIAQEKREAKLERDEAEKYQHMKDDLAAKQKLLCFSNCFYCERYGKQAEEELLQKRNQVAELEARKNEADELVNEKQKQVKRVQRDNHRLEKELVTRRREISHQRPLYVQVKQEALHVKTKLETSNKTLNAAQKLAEKNEEQVELLEKSAKRSGELVDVFLGLV